MANLIYPNFKEAMWTRPANSDVDAGNVKCALLDMADYTYDAAHEFLDDVAGSAIVATSGNLGSKTFTDGVFDCADFVFSAVTGDESEGLLYYIDTGVASTSRLICIKDTLVTGWPFTPNGGDANVTVDAAGVCAL